VVGFSTRSRRVNEIMPALKSSLNDTVEVRALGVVPPPAGKRRLWSQAELASHSLVVLTTKQLYLAPLGSDPRPETLAAIAAGGEVEDHLGSLATNIDLTGVSRVRLDLLTNSLNIDYLGREFSTSRVTIAFTSHEAADACFTKLWRRLGNGMKLNDFQRDKVELARAPLFILFVTLVITGVLALLISVAEDFGTARQAALAGHAAVGPLGETIDTIPASPLESLFGWMSWKVVCALGGAVAAASQVWMYRRLTTPPATLELVRSDG
jgi:hypothetical protein